MEPSESDKRKGRKSRIPNTADLTDEDVAKVALYPFGEAVAEQGRLQNQRARMGARSLLHRFHQFLRHASRKNVKHPMLTLIQEENQGAQLEVWKALGIILITRDDEMFRFLPAVLLDPEPQQSPQSAAPAYETVPLPSSDWIRTKHGYVPTGNRLFMGQLRLRSKGGFSRPTQ